MKRKIGLIIIFLTTFYYWALGKNMLDVEEKDNEVRTYELNPFTN